MKKIHSKQNSKCFKGKTKFCEKDSKNILISSSSNEQTHRKSGQARTLDQSKNKSTKK